MPYDTTGAAAPEQYGRLLEERYGPLDDLLAEAGPRSSPPSRTRSDPARPWRLRPIGRDQAVINLHDLAHAVGGPIPRTSKEPSA
ncbi:hypothetical protein ACIQXD_29810 [Streptomyces uncialis]|uniref:hypothetical protein n=1 Tax=Streptomyces uncialis TaxID=1048205 RepID=UPI0037FEDB56